MIRALYHLSTQWRVGHGLEILTTIHGFDQPLPITVPDKMESNWLAFYQMHNSLCMASYTSFIYIYID